MLGLVGLTEQPSWAAGVWVEGQQHLLVVTDGPSEEGMAHFHCPGLSSLFLRQGLSV